MPAPATKPQPASIPLPKNGREGDPPDSPYELAAAGARWWGWAWHTPQASQWNDGHLYTVARRATLEDDLDALGLATDEVALADLLSKFDMEAVGRVRWALDALAAQATGKLAIEKEMRELDGRLGLTPESMARLKWTVGEPEKEASKPDELRARRAARLEGRAVS